MNIRINQFVATTLSLVFTTSLHAQIIINEVNIGPSDYIELYNCGATQIDLENYTLNVRDSNRPSLDFTFPAATVAPSASIVIVAETPAAGEIDIANITYFHTRNLSLALRNPANNVIDFWAHGTALQAAPAGTTFNPAPLTLINTDTNATTYQRVAVTSSGTSFNASDWAAAPATRNAVNANQATVCSQINNATQAVPTLSEWALYILILSMGVLGFKFSQANRHFDI